MSIQLNIIRNARIPTAKFIIQDIQIDAVHQCPSYGDNNSTNDYDHSLQIINWINEWQHKYPFLTAIARIIKIWSRNNSINNSYHHTLPSLAYIVMLFHVCETEINQWKSSSSLPLPSFFPAVILCSFFHKYANWNRKVRKRSH